MKRGEEPTGMRERSRDYGDERTYVRRADAERLAQFQKPGRQHSAYLEHRPRGDERVPREYGGRDKSPPEFRRYSRPEMTRRGPRNDRSCQAPLSTHSTGVIVFECCRVGILENTADCANSSTQPNMVKFLLISMLTIFTAQLASSINAMGSGAMEGNLRAAVNSSSGSGGDVTVDTGLEEKTCHLFGMKWLPYECPTW
ncbi:hypothetical protein BBJ29_008199 [Phytophthora kernoviae]|uniref:Uncharacterized protein n=1 Tax=Phytophthora kernoviae TaxID=325452 RepID=A0A3F2RF19_9STRA|nr:hypothetical protein BBJ29_008199 [Phytophthora kernoviae]RLN55223.1 hypothetical protein BBP00_00008598 [Phytophthora kernoviae]